MNRIPQSQELSRNRLVVKFALNHHEASEVWWVLVRDFCFTSHVDGIVPPSSRGEAELCWDSCRGLKENMMFIDGWYCFLLFNMLRHRIAGKTTMISITIMTPVTQCDTLCRCSGKIEEGSSTERKAILDPLQILPALDGCRRQDGRLRRELGSLTRPVV